MKKIILLISISVLSTASCFGQSSYTAEDLQNATQALVRNDDSYIYRIKNEDLRNATLAKLRKDDSYIYRIKDKDLQNATKAEVREDDSYIYHIRDKKTR